MNISNVSMKDINFANIDFIRTDIEDQLRRILDKTGLFYRIFSRTKSSKSIGKKLKQKKEKYEKGEKMQDLFGVRIIFYFQEDVEIFYEYMKNQDNFDAKNESNTIKEIENINASKIHLEKEDNEHIKNLLKLFPLDDKLFMPSRLNLVVKLSEVQQDYLQKFLRDTDFEDIIDSTYELQLRTVFSEGWHEVEHDLRYKTKDESWWSYCGTESRMLNGIYANLETAQTALDMLVRQIAYKNYKQKQWRAMVANHFCLRVEGELNQEIANMIDESVQNDKKVNYAKDLLRFNKAELVRTLLSIPDSYKLNIDNIIFLVNRLGWNDDRISYLEPNPTKIVLNRHFRTEG